MVKKTLHRHSRAVKQAALKAGEFFIHTVLVAVPLYILFSSTTFLHEIAARLSQFFLSLLGKKSTLSFNGVPFLQVGNLSVEISNLCAGGLELALLAGFILASKDRSKEHRAKGLVAGFLFFTVFNASRIAFTVNSFGTVWFEPLHEALFRT
ncbi:MAG: archaeosortase/exosortase family protein, partial [Candidatus Micrarchaeota archaeon]|nr:archaeosortase/exosortase family protein [Candidatus Micrarchaeota archaeon]